MNSDSILDVRHLKQYFHVNKNLTINAIDDVSFQIRKGEYLVLLAKQGQGKSTIARTVMGIYPPTGGEIYYKGNMISEKKIFHQNKKDIQRNMQIIFQDSAAALNPRMTVEKIIAEPLKINHIISRKGELKKR